MTKMKRLLCVLVSAFMLTSLLPTEVWASSSTNSVTLSASGTDATVVSWNEVSGATGYTVSYTTTAGTYTIDVDAGETSVTIPVGYYSTVYVTVTVTATLSSGRIVIGTATRSSTASSYDSSVSSICNGTTEDGKYSYTFYWSEYSGAAYYNLYVDFDGEVVLTGLTSTTANVNLTEGDHTVCVCAYDENEGTPLYAYVLSITADESSVPLQELTVEFVSCGVKISWDEVDGAVAYSVNGTTTTNNYWIVKSFNPESVEVVSIYAVSLEGNSLVGSVALTDEYFKGTKTEGTNCTVYSFSSQASVSVSSALNVTAYVYECIIDGYGTATVFGVSATNGFTVVLGSGTAYRLYVYDNSFKNLIAYAEVPATSSSDSHEWDDGVTVTEATCTTYGMIKYTREVCGETKYTVVQLADHNYVDGVCTVCGAEDPNYSGGEDDCTHENTEVKHAVEATCTESGYTGDTVCTDCGETVETGVTIPATGHTYEDGVCTVCGEVDPDADSGDDNDTDDDEEDDTDDISDSTTFYAIYYINFNYHMVVVDGVSSIEAHSVMSNGYCAFCGAYIGFSTSGTVLPTVTTVDDTAVTDVGETVIISEPTEPGDVSEEPDDLTVTEPEISPAAESNPKTGAVIALLPMAIATFALVGSKRR